MSAVFHLKPRRRGAGPIGAALLIGLGGLAQAGSPAPKLGTPEGCAAYGGLPEGWGQNPKAGMVRVKGGEFVLGTRLGYEDERPEVRTQVGGFWIDQTEVTVAQFGAFVQATGYVTEAERQGGAVVFRQPGAQELEQRDYAWWGVVKGAAWNHPTGPGSAPAHASQPVTLVTFNDALAYARWLGRDLPTEAQWEYAAKAGRQDGKLEHEPRDAHGKPIANFWQGRFPGTNSAEDGYVGLSPVGCYPANGFQLYDTRGNAWEQTKDVYTGPHRAPEKAPSFARAGEPNQPMVIKGGSHLCGRDFCVRYRPSAREAHEANLPVSHIGFRTVLND